MNSIKFPDSVKYDYDARSKLVVEAIAEAFRCGSYKEFVTRIKVAGQPNWGDNTPPTMSVKVILELSPDLNVDEQKEFANIKRRAEERVAYVIKTASRTEFKVSFVTAGVEAINFYSDVPEEGISGPAQAAMDVYEFLMGGRIHYRGEDRG